MTMREEIVRTLARCLYLSDPQPDDDWDYTPQAEALLPHLEAMGCVVQAWQGIESAPRDGARVLLSGHRGCEVDIGSWGNGRFLGRTRGYNQTWVTLPGFEVNPTHWMPLPAPPLAAASPLPAPGRGG